MHMRVTFTHTSNFKPLLMIIIGNNYSSYLHQLNDHTHYLQNSSSIESTSQKTTLTLVMLNSITRMTQKKKGPKSLAGTSHAPQKKYRAPKKYPPKSLLKKKTNKQTGRTKIFQTDGQFFSRRLPIAFIVKASLIWRRYLCLSFSTFHELRLMKVFVVLRLIHLLVII